MDLTTESPQKKFSHPDITAKGEERVSVPTYTDPKLIGNCQQQLLSQLDQFY